MADAWGTNTYGVNGWGAQDSVNLTVTGLSVTSSIGSTTQEAGAGHVIVQAQSLNITNAGIVAGTSANPTVTGQQLTLGIGEEVTGVGVPVTGINASFTIGTAVVDETTLTGEGWGRSQWGSFAWGDNYSVQVTGIPMTSSIGEETAFTDVTVEIDSFELPLAFGLISLQIDQDEFVFAAPEQLDYSIGDLSFVGDANVTVTSAGQLTSSAGQAVGGLKTPVDVTGIEANITLGDITLIQSTVEPVTGQQLTGSLGIPTEIPFKIMGVTGVEAAMTVGSVTVVGTSVIQPTGIELNISTSPSNVTSWQEIDPGVNNTWSDVDLAA